MFVTVTCSSFEIHDSVQSETKQNVTDPGYSDGVDIDYQVLLNFMFVMVKSSIQGFERKTKQKSQKTLDEKQEKKMKSLAREFCRWTDTLGAGEPNIDQETIETLFAPSKAYFHLKYHKL